MTRKEAIETEAMLARLQSIGISRADAEALRRISMTLHRWHELECGDGNDHGSWCITRGHQREGGPFVHREEGLPYLEYHSNSSNAARYTRVPDREKGARKRLAAIMARYPTLQFYVQGDPRGAALYILRPGDVPAPVYKNVDAYYSRGLAVYK